MCRVRRQRAECRLVARTKSDPPSRICPKNEREREVRSHLRHSQLKQSTRHAQLPEDAFSSLFSSLELSDTKVYKPQIRALLGTAAHLCKEVVLKLRAGGGAVPAETRSEPSSEKQSARISAATRALQHTLFQQRLQYSLQFL